MKQYLNVYIVRPSRNYNDFYRVYISRAEEFLALIKKYTAVFAKILRYFSFVLISPNSPNLSVYFKNFISSMSYIINFKSNIITIRTSYFWNRDEMWTSKLWRNFLRRPYILFGRRQIVELQRVHGRLKQSVVFQKVSPGSSFFSILRQCRFQNRS